MPRIFLAIDLPMSLRPLLTRVQAELKQSGADVRWVPAGNVHLTLKFFGEIPETQVEPLAQAAARVAAGQAPFQLHVTVAGAFPSPKNPRVVWLGLGGDLEVLRHFHQQLERAFADLGYPPEDRPFAAHLTLGRVKSPAGRHELTRRLAQLPACDGPPFPVREIVLFQSRLSPQGATYTPLKIIPLGE